MKNPGTFPHISVVLIFICLLALFACKSSPEQKSLFTLPDKQHGLVEKAMPNAGSVTPAKPRKLLVYHGCEGFAHGSINICNKTIEVMSEKTGAFEAEFSDQMTAFEKNNLKRFDGILLNNTTQLKFENPEHRQALLEFVKSGKGLIGIHAATDNFPTWPEGARMIGGVFDGHPWTSNGLWAIKIDEPDHPLNQAFNKKAFLIKDEIYQIKAPYSRENLRVLLSLDMTNKRNQDLNGIKRKDNDFAISWIQPYGKGRVFYCSLGHNDEVFWNPAVLGHYLDGIQYAFGDLKADHVPSLALDKQPIPALTTTQGAVDDPYLNVATYKFDKCRFTLSLLEEEARTASEESLKNMEQKLIGLLKSKTTSFAGKQFIFKMLRRIGTKASLPILEELLTHKTYSDGARFVLEGMDDPKVNQILIDAIDIKQKTIAMGLISTLARRKAREAVKKLAYLIQTKHQDLALTALEALGRIGGQKAAAALAKITPTEDQKILWANSYLSCADSLFQEGQEKEALVIYSKLSEKGGHTQIRIAAWSGLVGIQKKRSAPFLLGLLEEEDEKILHGAAKLIANLPADMDMSLFVSAYPNLPKESRILLLSCLASRNEIQGLPLSVSAAKSQDSEERIAGVRALGVLGGASEVALLAKITGEQGDLGDEAVLSLNRLSDPGADEAILLAMDKADGLERAALIPCLGERSMGQAVTKAIQYSADETPEVREESLHVLKKLCTIEDLHTLIPLIEKLEDPNELSLLNDAICAALNDLDEMEDKASAILDIMGKENPDVKAHLLGIVAQFNCEKSLQALLLSLEDDAQKVKTAAACALAEWTTAQPMDQVLKIASDPKMSPDTASACLKGAMRMALLSNDRTPAITMHCIADGPTFLNGAGQGLFTIDVQTGSGRCNGWNGVPLVRQS